MLRGVNGTGADGRYTFTNLPPGPYELKTELSGFAQIRREVILAVGDVSTVDLAMALDGITDPRNLGAVLRSAGAFGVHGVLVPGAFGERGSEGARRVALHDDELCIFDCSTDASGHVTHIPVRVRLHRAVQLYQRRAGEVETGGIEVRMLAGQDDPRDNPTAGERSCYG